MRLRSIAAVVLLVLVAAAGVVVVRELTRPPPREPIGPIQLDPGAQAGEDQEPSRRGDRDGEGGFDAPAAAEQGAATEGPPDTTSPQIEVRTPEAADGSDDGGDGD